MDRLRRHPVLVVAMIAAAVRLLVLLQIPLIITNDGVGYLRWAQEFLGGVSSTIPTVRTPGYPLFLAAVFLIFGVGGIGVLICQHALGIGMAAIISRVVTHLHGPTWGIAIGCIAGVCPWIMVWESYALTESLVAFLVISALAICLCGQVNWSCGLLLGATLGLACLVRPSVQLLVPFFIAGWLLKRGARPRLLATGACVLGLAAPTAPWLIHNAHRGVTGLASGGTVAFWWGMAMHDALDDSYPLPTTMQTAYARLRSAPPTDATIGDFIATTDAWNNPDVERVLSEWTRASIRSHPKAYARGVASSLRSQLELRPAMETDSGWFLWRTARDGAELGQAAGNYQVTIDSAELESFRMPAGHGIAAHATDWCVRHRPRGLPQALLFIVAIIAGISLISRRNWSVAIILAGTGALFLIHPVMLLPFSRYGLPAWVCWLTVLPEAMQSLARARLRLRAR